MLMDERKIHKILFWLLVISTVVRGLAAALIEFGNDEVYYWTFALYPDWSHYITIRCLIPPEYSNG